MTSWHSLYLSDIYAKDVTKTLREVLEAHGYKPYDPFPGGTGTPPMLHDMVRLFVAPSRDGWVRVLGQPAEPLLAEFSTAAGVPVLYGWLTDDGGGFALFSKGARHDDPAAFEPYRRVDQPAEQLAQAFAGELSVPVLPGESPAVVSGNVLPPEIQQLAKAKGVKPSDAEKLAQRISGRLFGKADKKGGEEQEQARAIVTDAGRDVWNSLNGQRVRAIASVLNLPDNWRSPTLDAVRDAYHLHRLRQRNPRLPLMPGDQATMDAVPDALSYMPVYVGFF